jgi:branched-chain amino acid transport system substrate-binding protein
MNLRTCRYLVAALLALATMPAAMAQAVKPIRVGLIAPLTGGSADFGNSVRFGAELALKEINEVGGYRPSVRVGRA